MTDDIWVLPAVVAGCFLLPLALTVGVCLWERRPVQPYFVPEPGTEYTPSGSAATANRAAERAGFDFAGLCHDAKPLIWVRYDFRLSPDRDTLALIGSGTVAGVPQAGLSLYSATADGRVLATGTVAGDADISGVEEQRVWPGSGFDAVWDRHQRRSAGVVVEPFPAASPLASYFCIRRLKAEALVGRGYARYLDADQAVWRYTLRGAVVFAVTAMWVRPVGRALRAIGLGSK